MRPALLWNDTRSAGAARDLLAELGGGQALGRRGRRRAGRLLHRHQAALAGRITSRSAAARVAAVCLPHDWLTWRLMRLAARSLDALRTDRSDASGTGYWSAAAESYRPDLLERAFGRAAARARACSAPPRPPGSSGPARCSGPGTGDNAAAALGVGAGPGDVVVSIGTSGVVSAVADVPARDPSGIVAGFADATGRLPAAGLHAQRVPGARRDARLLGVDHDGLSRLALSAPPGADGLVLVPYLEGERTPNRPDATGALHGLTLELDHAGAPRPGRGRGTALRAGRRARRPRRAGRDGPAGAARRWRRAIGGGTPDRAGRARVPRRRTGAGGVRRRRRRAAGGLGALRRERAAALGGRGDQTFEADPTPAVRERYAAVRDLTADRIH